MIAGSLAVVSWRVLAEGDEGGERRTPLGLWRAEELAQASSQFVKASWSVPVLVTVVTVVVARGLRVVRA